jgi:hypothetical protein
MFIVAGVLTFSPWLIRNWAWTGNPVFPEAQSILGRAHFTETQEKRWHDAHSPTPAQQALGARFIAAWHQIVTDWRYGFLLLPAGCIGAAIAIRRPEAKLILSLLLAWLFFWIALTHLQGRFFVTAIPLAALGLAMMRPGRELVFAGVVAVVVVIVGLTIQISNFSQHVGVWRDRRWLAIDDLKGILPEEIADAIEKGERIVLIGDARAFWYQTPTAKLRYRTVFDVDVKPGQRIDEAWLGDGQTDRAYVVLDAAELDRFSKTYYGIPPLPSDESAVPRDHPAVIPPRN